MNSFVLRSEAHWAYVGEWSELIFDADFTQIDADFFAVKATVLSADKKSVVISVKSASKKDLT